MNIVAEIQNAPLFQSEFPHQSVLRPNATAEENLEFQRLALSGLGGTDSALNKCKHYKGRQRSQ
jgi:hypothetical protein